MDDARPHVRDRKPEPSAPVKPAAAGLDDLMQTATAAVLRGDYNAALAAWNICAHNGVARAQAEIGRCFVDALGVERDTTLAHTWLKLAADAKDAYGQRLLGDYYFNGEDGKQDRAIAEEWYARAAAQGEPLAQEMLSWIYAEGDSRTPDYAKARAYAEAAAAQGVAKSMTRLGFLYHNAMGVPRDAAMAASWWLKAARLDDADGQAMYGAALHLGAGVPRAPLQAYAWLTRAKAGGSGFADRFLPAAALALPAEQRAEGDRIAALPLAAVVP